MNPTITVVTVVLNAAKVLPRLVEVLRGQTDRDFEFIVVDGASHDGTQDIIASAPDLVTRSISEPDQGFFDAINKAIGLIKTDYYLPMGADDILYPDAIAQFRAVVQKTQADVVVADVKAGKGLRRGYHPQMGWLSPSRIYTSHSVGTLIRTNLHARFGLYSLKFPISSDTLFVKRMSIAQDVKVVAGGFVSGEFALEGFSNNNIVRSICELWMVQRETGENPLLQYLLFQLRLFWNFPKIISRQKK
jgi:glycosyltransferase involved in cell wall biosynthesis